ncbi:MAG: hypothetical protein K2N63_03470, partial [Lachnospiraceae bacterium]|nr:hypothetical protein [Lachnospiraceae bacterium]
MADNNTSSGAHLSSEDYGISTPSSEGGIPAYSGSSNTNSGGDYGIALPIAPEGGIPAYPGNTNGSSGGSNNDYGISLPIAPEGGIPAYPGNMGNTGGSNNCTNCTP